MEWSGCRVGENQLCEGCREEGGLFVKLAIIKLSKFRILNFEAFFLLEQINMSVLVSWFIRKNLQHGKRSERMKGGNTNTDLPVSCISKKTHISSGKKL